MNKILFCLSFLIVVTSIKGQSIIQKKVDNQTNDTLIREFDFSQLVSVEFTKHNSETCNYEQVGKRKNEMYNIYLTPKYFDWKNPTMGGAVHINKRDEIEVYQFTFGIFQYKNDTGIFYTEAAKDTFIILKDIKELLYNVGGVGFGNSASILITSEIRLDKSEAIKRVMRELCVPSVQIYYLTKMK